MRWVGSHSTSGRAKKEKYGIGNNFVTVQRESKSSNLLWIVFCTWQLSLLLNGGHSHDTLQILRERNESGVLNNELQGHC